MLGFVAKKEYRIQPFTAGIALIRHFLSCKLSHLAHDPPVQVIARSVCRDLRQNLSFAAKPSVTALPETLCDKEINDENAPAVPSANARVVQIEIRQAAVVRRFLGMFENVPNPTNRMNQRSRGVVIHFAA